MAQIIVPEGFVFTGAEGARKFMELNQNPVSSDEMGLVLPQSNENDEGWFVIFQFNDVGHVKDDEKNALDADGLLKSIRSGNDEANKNRKQRGWAELQIVGWQRPPFYDPQTHNLEWAIRGSGEGGEVVNYSTRLLGRTGVMNADLVLGPEQLDSTIPKYKQLLSGFSFTSGHAYAEFRPGDKVAKYGLAALIAGGAGVVAAKTGLLAKLWKVIAVGVLAVVAGLRKIFARIFGFRKRESPMPPAG